jgi:hypothetical protein
MSYTCHCCNKVNEGNAWMKIRAPDGPPHHLCSYLCYTQSESRYPRNLSQYVMNREDFNYLYPIQTKVQNPSFRLLKHDDFLQMTDAEIHDYYDRLEEATIDPIQLAVHEEEEREDMRTRELELDDEEIYDDY